MLFSKSIYLAILRRYWAGGALLTVILALNAFSYAQNLSRFAGNVEDYSAGWLFRDPSALIFIVIASVICASLVFSFIQDKRAVVMFHSLPVRREAMFSSAFLGGLTLLWVPALFYMGLIIFAQISVGLFSGTFMLVWFMLTFLFSLLAFSTVVFAGQLTGQGFAQYVVAALIVGLPIFLELFVSMHCQMFLFGYAGTELPVNIAVNPYALMVLLIDGAWTIAGRKIIHICAVLAFIALLITASVLLYKRRKLEMAGEFLAVRGMRPVFRYGAAFLAAFLFEGISMGIFRNETRFGMVFFGVIGGALGFIIAEMLIRRTVRVFRHLKGAAVFAGCFVLFILALHFDVMGYGSYTPPADKVESIYLSNSRRWDDSKWDIEPVPYHFTDEASIAAALELQRIIVTERPEAEGDFSDHFIARGRQETYHMEVTLKSGRTVTRRYHVWLENNSRIDDLAKALDEAAKPLLIERLRNIGREGDSVRLDWQGPYHPLHFSMDADEYAEYYGYDYDITYAREVPVTDSGEPLLRQYQMLRQDIPGFIGALVEDNMENPRWHYWQGNGNVLISAWVTRESGEWNYGRGGRLYSRNSHQVYVYSDDDNTLEWLRDNGYLG
jgi:ABC-2 type transport system permease protein